MSSQPNRRRRTLLFAPALCLFAAAPARAQLAQITEGQHVSVPELVDDNFFGHALDVQDDILVVSAIYSVPQPHRGTVFVFAHDGTSWNETQRLELPQGLGVLGNWYFGWSVDLDGDRLLVGSINVGCLVYTRSGDQFVNPEPMNVSDFSPNRMRDAELDGSRVAYARPGDGYYTTGSIYVFERGPSGWTQDAKIDCPPPCVGAYGWAFELEGDWLAVSAEVSYGGAGIVHMYRRDASGWVLTQTLSGSPTDTTFGGSPSLHGDRLALNAEGGPRIYQRVGTSWVFQETIQGPPQLGPNFIGRLTLRDDGLWASRSSGLPWPGLYHFTQEGGAWLFRARYAPRDDDQRFSWSTVDDDWVVVSVTGGFPLGREALTFERRGVPATFCSARDGAVDDAACACGAAGGLDTGCDNDQGTGGVRLSLSRLDREQGRLSLVSEGYPPAREPLAVALFSQSARPPMPFTDGVLCVDTSNGWPPVGVTRASNGVAAHEITHGTGPVEHVYQVLYRSGRGCGSAANLSNALSVPW